MFQNIRTFIATFRFARKQSVSMQRRMVFLMVCLTLAAFSVLIFLLFISGVFSFGERKVETSMNVQLNATQSRIQRDMENLSARAIDLSGTLARGLDTDLATAGISFTELNDRSDELLKVQSNAFGTLNSILQLSSCSGTYMVLNVTTNTAIPESAYSRSGLYLRKSNVNSDVMTQPYIKLFRGIPDVARKVQMELHNRWNLEFDIRYLPQFEETVAGSDYRPAESYFWTEKIHLQETWEDALLLCVPMTGSNGTCYGICGVEISALHFSFAYPAVETEAGTMYTVLAPYENGELCIDRGLCGGLDGLFPLGYESLHIQRGRYGDTYSNGSTSFVGLSVPVKLSKDQDGTQWAVTVLLPMQDYLTFVNAERMRYAFIAACFLAFFIAATLIVSRRFVNPIVEGLNILQSEEPIENMHSEISEIDTLMRFVQSRNAKPSLIQNELPPNIKEMFDTIAKRAEALTVTERMILHYYSEGYDVNAVANMACISVNTLRKHNSNIYTKLGVGSRDALLTYLDLFRRCNRLDDLLKGAENRSEGQN